MLNYAPLWTVGVINGFLPYNKGIPAEYKYGAIGTASALYILKKIKATPLPIKTSAICGTMLGIPIMASVFYGGTYFGKAVRYMVDDYSDRIIKTLEDFSKEEKVQKKWW